MKLHSWNMHILCAFITLSFLLSGSSTSAFTHQHYVEALGKSILFFEGQRSGKLPATQRIDWRGYSALSDGKSVRDDLDLVGGYYDAGDNIKFGLPMAFTITLLSWSVIEFGEAMGNEIEHAKDAIGWGTDYLLKASGDISKGVLYVQVGNPIKEHPCWERPEDLDHREPRPVYSVTADKPGSEVAGETAAALAAASIVFKDSKPGYSDQLLKRAKVVFEFALNHRGSYSQSLGDVVRKFYNSVSGYNDELLWAAAWLHHASGNDYYLDAIAKLRDLNDDLTFSWDNKKPGTKVLLSKIFLESGKQDLEVYTEHADTYVGHVLNGPFTPGGLYYLAEWSNLQHLTASFLLVTHAKQLKSAELSDVANKRGHKANELIEFAKRQVDYVLGDNPEKMSYMVGFGERYPLQLHHRGSSLPSVSAESEPMFCKTEALTSTDPNPNLHVGAIVGGPDSQDRYRDKRENYEQSEPITYINAAFVGVVASLLAQ